MADRVWTPPALSAIRAFEAAARLLSFTKAAGELNVTQSAISHGVRELETRLGVRLFERDGRMLALCEAGRLYLPFAAEALERLRAGDAALGDPLRRARILTVSVSPSFAARWLVPRLGDFSTAHPDLDLRISASVQHIAFHGGEIDVAVRHGDGNWPSLHAVRLCAEQLFPVCHPALLERAPIAKPDDLKRHTLLHHRDDSGWRTWLQAFGAAIPAQFAHAPSFNEMSLVIEAALAGQGVALARSALVARDLAAGRLVRPLQEALQAPFSYWIVCPKPQAALAKIVRFRDWLLAQAAQDETVLSRKPSRRPRRASKSTRDRSRR